MIAFNFVCNMHDKDPKDRIAPAMAKACLCSEGIIVLINAGIAAWTESKAGDALEAPLCSKKILHALRLPALDLVSDVWTVLNMR